MKIFGKLISGVAKLLRWAFRKSTKAQDEIKKAIKKQPKIAKSIQKSIFGKENISTKSTKSIIASPISNNDYKAFKSEYAKIKVKELRGIKLSTIDKQFKDFVDNVLIDDDNQDETYYFKNSRYLIMLIYKKKSKTALIKMKDGTIPFYPFYNVPKDKVIDLLLFNGEYMWSHFGRRYSANPEHWIRKVERDK